MSMKNNKEILQKIVEHATTYLETLIQGYGIENVNFLIMPYPEETFPQEIIELISTCKDLYFEKKPFCICSAKDDALEEFIQTMREFMVNDENYEQIKAFEKFADYMRKGEAHFLGDIDLNKIKDINKGEIEGYQ